MASVLTQKWMVPAIRDLGSMISSMDSAYKNYRMDPFTREHMFRGRSTEAESSFGTMVIDMRDSSKIIK